ncbi:MAG TPA: hypothetical protein VGI68_22465 [Mycobacterium sp.]
MARGKQDTVSETTLDKALVAGVATLDELDGQSAGQLVVNRPGFGRDSLLGSGDQASQVA